MYVCKMVNLILMEVDQKDRALERLYSPCILKPIALFSGGSRGGLHYTT